MAHLLLLNAVPTDYDNVNFIPYPLLYLKSFLNTGGHSVEIIDFQLGKKKVKQFKNSLMNKPDILGISIFLGNSVKLGKKAAALCKKISPNTIIVFGGILATLNPELILKDTVTDYVISFEGEMTLLQLSDNISKNKKDINIPNLISRDNLQSFPGNQRPQMNLDNLLPISFEDVADEKYIIEANKYGKRGVSLFTSKGCPFNCSFCYNTTYNDGKWRSFPVQWVLDTVNKLVKIYNIDVLLIFDDNFFVDYDRVIKIMEGTKKKGHDIKWWAEIRVDQALSISIDQYEQLYNLGLRELYISPESGSDKTLKLLNKNILVKDTLNLNKLLSKTKVYVTYSLMICVPGESYEEIMQTIDLSIKLREENNKASIWGINNYIAYPGTKLFDKAKSNGFKPYDSLMDLNCRFDYRAPKLPWSPISKTKQEMISIASKFQKSDKIINSLPFKQRIVAKIFRFIFEFRLRNRIFFPFFDFWLFKIYFISREKLFNIKMRIK